MVRAIKILILCLLTVSGFAQVVQERNARGADRIIILKDGFRVPIRDTATAPALLNYSGDSSRGGVVYDSTLQKLCFWTGVRWVCLDDSATGGSIDTISLSNRINLKLNISDTATMLNPYIRGVIGGTNVTIDNTNPRLPVINASGGGGGTPGGSNRDIQYNNSGSFAGDSAFRWNNTLNQLQVRNNRTAVVSSVLSSDRNKIEITAEGSLEQRPNIGLIYSNNLGNANAALFSTKTRGTLSSPTATNINDDFFGFVGGGFDGTNPQFGAGILFSQDSQAVSGRVPARIDLVTGANTSNRVARLRILHDGRITTPNNARFWNNAYPVTRFERLGDVGNNAYSTITLRAKGTAATLGNGFGTELSFEIENSTGSISQYIGGIAMVRAGADNTSDFVVRNRLSGTTFERLRVTSAGRVGINTTAPATSSVLEIVSTTGGVLFPRMTTTQRNAISSPVDGLVIYNTTDAKLQVRAGGAWVDLH